VINLSGGIKAWQGLTAAGPAEMGMSTLRGDEPPEEIVALAYAMEDGMGDFYTRMAEDMDDAEVVRVFTILGGVEEKHKQRLFELYMTLDPSVRDQESLESKVVSEHMEGGYTTDVFLEKNRHVLKTVEDILNLAMTLEAQSMDLYARYSQKIVKQPSKEVLFDLAEEEKAHLASLGDLLEKRVEQG
jgi:sulfur-carrier protein adenylyltransferase/sulfurtransferase